MTILITGGAGYLGNVLVDKLISANMQAKYGIQLPDGCNKDSHVLKVNKIIVYDNLLYKQLCLVDKMYKGNMIEFVYGDVRDQKKLLPYVNQADVIIPLAAIVGMPACAKDPILANAVNFEHIKFISDNVTNLQKILYPNTNSGYGVGHGTSFCTEDMPLTPISIYGKTKCMAEQYLLDSGNAITLRLATVFGVSQRMRLDLLVNDFVYKAINDGYIVLFEKDFKRNYIHIRDVALTFIYLINNYDKLVGNAFNVGLSSANISKLELAEEIKKMIPNFSIQYDDIRNDPDKRNYIVSNTKLETTGWTPYYTLHDGIQELIKAYEIIKHCNTKFTNL